MKKLLVIESCRDCPHGIKEQFQTVCWNTYHHAGIPIGDPIPEWCPLPDAKEKP